MNTLKHIHNLLRRNKESNTYTMTINNKTKFVISDFINFTNINDLLKVKYVIISGHTKYFCFDTNKNKDDINNSPTIIKVIHFMANKITDFKDDN
jgi:hypothetical protein